MALKLPRRLLPRSTTLRIALGFLVLFGGTSSLLMAGIYWTTSRFLMFQVDGVIGDDIALLTNAARERGHRSLAAILVTRARQAGEAQAVYLLTDQDGTPRAGNLATWPKGLEATGWAILPATALTVVPVTDTLPPPPRRPDHPEDSERRQRHREAWDDWRPPLPDTLPPPPPRLFANRGGRDPADPDFRPPPWQRGDVRVAALTLPSGMRLLIGRDLGPIQALRHRVAGAMRLGLGGMVVLGLVGGLVMSRRFGRRLEAVNRTSREIIGGDLSRRVPQGRGLDGDDFDQLAVNLNAMLGRIETLMEGVRHVSDTIAHDLRTPLSRLRNRLERLQADAQCTDRDELAAALAEVDSLLATFHALLRIAQVETGGRRMAFSPVDLLALLIDVAELYDAVADERTVTLDLDLALAPGTRLLVDGDRDLLFQAFANLLDNAVKYSPEGGRVSLALVRGETQATISLRDQGPGIPAADRQRVFERFARLDTARTTPGNGLGLTMVGAVIEAHDGTIALEDAPGGGLLVRVVLPLRRGPG
ncbi:two-component sensor histidine kinase [Rhodospirillum rubrum]|uniref:sensor histidine kinase n=1 Tax=Rhodospirillum rubrum TaxID=1085 RepID=UPI0019047ABE|nr:HAMP domain-containing sensor histidine kinase [Rhodospirillum rubrum]MBK1663830.1 two-component sensor histidine kinase [Rhodospirillum rubrum]MBK1678262.1 two-component sensor histidine kinase [Rhodospirillum rubrum]